MAHTCPECGQVCYCGGDIDDCLMETDETYINCQHYLVCRDYPDEDDYGE